MTFEEESYVLDSIERIRASTAENNRLLKENNIMLKQIIRVINTHLARHHQENDDDFNRNVLANVVSNIFNVGKMRGAR